MDKQYVTLVNKQNRKTGVEEKIKAHQEGLLHRAFSIFIFNAKGELLLQQRHIDKYHSGGLWTNTVCSHPRPNETYHQATHRRLHEEMGFDCPLTKLFCFIYQADFPNGLKEHEYDCIFIGKFDGKPIPNKQEIMDYSWITLEKLEKDIQNNPEKYSVWLKIALKKMIKSDMKEVLRSL